MWTSKLGAKFPRSDIERLDTQHHRELKRLRSLPANALCAECFEPDTCWTSVSLGLFLCVRCSDVHRALGTHISKVKGCSGTYLWGPDEIARMQELGNDAAKCRYGPAPVPAANVSKDERVRLCSEKYEQLRWAGQGNMEDPVARNVPREELPRSKPQPPVAQSVSALVPRVQQAPLDFDIDAIFEALHGEKSAPAQPVLPLGAAVAWPQRPLEDFLDHCLEVAPLSLKAAPASTMPDFWADFGEW